MSNDLTPALLVQLYGQDSSDPFLMLVTLSHTSFGNICLVNNSENITSNSIIYTAFPMSIILPADDGEKSREVSIEFDNVSLELVNEIRTVTTPINIKVDMVLASNPNIVQISLDDLKVKNITYDKSRIRAKIIMDDFLSVELTSEKYNPSNFPGLF